MAKVAGLYNNALPYPVYARPWGVVFPILDADGDLVTGAAGLDSEVSLDGDTFADCTNEATEIATSSGMYYLLLTNVEMAANVVTVIVKTSTSGAKTTPIVLYTRALPAVRLGTAQGGTTANIILDSGASAMDDAYNGCMCVGFLDGTVEVRMIADYTGSTKTATVENNFWTIAPDSNDDFAIYLPDGVLIPTVNVKAISDDTGAADNAETAFDGGSYNVGGGGIVAASVTGAVGSVTGAVGSVTGNVGGNVTGSVGSVTGNVGGNVTGSVGSVVGAVGSVTGNVGGNVTGSVGSVVGAVGSVTGNVGGNVTGSVGSVAAGGITAASIATGAIDADALATDAVNEIADGTLNRDMGAVSDTNARTLLNAIRFIRNKWAITAGTLVVTKEDDTTTAWTAATTQTPGDPTSEIDPA